MSEQRKCTENPQATQPEPAKIDQPRRARRPVSRKTEEANFRLRSQLYGGERGPKDKGEDGPSRHYPPLERVCSACTAHPSSLSASHDPLLSKYTLSALSNDGRTANRAAFFWPHGTVKSTTKPRGGTRIKYHGGER